MWTRALGLALAVLAATPAAAGDRKLVYGVFLDGCDRTCQGFEDGLKAGGINADVIVRPLPKDKSQYPAMVQEARHLKVDLIVTYGTPATIGMIGTLADETDPRFIHDIPVVFTVVADPFGAKLAKSFDGTGRPNIAGTFNRAPESVNIEVIRAYDPSFDTLGLLYNSDELNSALKKDELEKLSQTLGFRLVAIEMAPSGGGEPDPAVIPSALAKLGAEGVRWLYLGSSSFLRSNGELFTAQAVENGIAVVSPYEDLVREHHALLSIAADLYDVGKLAAGQAVRILRDGATPGDLPLAVAADFGYVVNMAVARKLNRFPPLAFMEVAQTVN